jgi:hypothetical protein
MAADVLRRRRRLVSSPHTRDLGTARCRCDVGGEGRGHRAEGLMATEASLSWRGGGAQWVRGRRCVGHGGVRGGFLDASSGRDDMRCR